MRGAGTRSRQSFGPGFELCVAGRVKTAFEADLEAVELAMARRDRLMVDDEPVAQELEHLGELAGIGQVRDSLRTRRPA